MTTVTEQGATELRFEGFDALPCLTLVLWALGSLPLLAPWAYPYWIYVFAGLLALAAGMRVTISVTPGSVRVAKKWLFIPYWRARASQIRDVWYDGDWGFPEGAMGVVLDLDRTKVHVGSSRSMKFLFESLRPLSVVGSGASGARG